ncbi:MAG: hypothetical protein ACOY4O_09290 [Pseudomonadota bacterium]
MSSADLDTPETGDDAQPRGLLRQAAISAIMILLGIKITVDVLSRRWRSTGT